MPRQAVKEKAKFRVEPLPAQPVEAPAEDANANREAARARWAAEKKWYEQELAPFNELDIEAALRLLERKRKVTEDAGHIVERRLNEAKGRVQCVTCKKDLSKLLEGGKPAYVWKGDYRDQKTGVIFSRYACSALCHNAYMKKTQGAMGTTAESA